VRSIYLIGPSVGYGNTVPETGRLEFFPRKYFVFETLNVETLNGAKNGSVVDNLSDRVVLRAALEIPDHAAVFKILPLIHVV
jgi:hypothetical protein